MFTDPTLVTLHDDLIAQRRALVDEAALVPQALRHSRPAADRWSVAEVLAHVALVESRITQFLAVLGTSAPPRDAAGGTPEHAVDMEFLLDRTRAFQAPQPLHPPADTDAEGALAQMESSREALLTVMLALDGRALDRMSRPHPVLGMLNGYQWLASIAAHEARHAAQIREIAHALGAAADQRTSSSAASAE